HADHPLRDPCDHRDRRTRGRADQGPPGPRGDLQGPRRPRRSARHGRRRAPQTTRARRQGHQRPVRHDPGRVPRHRSEGENRRGKEAEMILEWIGDAILLLVVLPVVVYLLRGVLNAANSIVPSVGQIATAAQKGSTDLDAAALLLTTQGQVIKTIETAADYGGSLDVILDDAR